MSTSDKWTHSWAVCPCGKGEILRHVDSPDNGYSRTTFDYSLSCADCEKDWMLEFGELRTKAGDAAQKIAFKQREAAEKELTKQARSAIDLIVEGKNFESYRREHDFLTAAKVCLEGPIRYGRFRKEGDNPGDHCTPLGHLSWIIENTSDAELRTRLREGQKALKAAELALQGARKAMKAVSAAV